MNKKIISSILILIIITILAIMIIPNESDAYSVSPASINLTVGGTATITINSSGETGRYDIASSNSSVATVSPSSAWGENNSVSITITAKAAGSATITVTPTDVSNSATGSAVSGARQIAVTVSNPTPKPSPTPTPAPTFQSVNQTVYATTEVNVRSSYSTSSNRIGSLQKGQSVTRTGIGSNGWSRVTFNGQTGYINSQYLTTTKPAEEPTTEPSTQPSTEPSTPPEETTNDAKLKSLSIVGVELTPEFNPDITSYSANIGEEITEVEVVAEVNNEKTKYEIAGNTELQDGENTVTITVTAEDGTVTTYEIKLLKNVVPAPIEDNTPEITNKTETKINYKLILIIGAIALITIIGITFAILYYRKQNDMEYARPDYSFLREEEEKPKNTLEQIYDEKNNGQNDDDNDNFRRGGRHF